MLIFWTSLLESEFKPEKAVMCVYVGFSTFKLRLLQAPVHTIAANAGVEGAVVVGKLLEQDNPDLGYDAAKGLSYFFHKSSLSFCPKI